MAKSPENIVQFPTALLPVREYLRQKLRNAESTVSSTSEPITEEDEKLMREAQQAAGIEYDKNEMEELNKTMQQDAADKIAKLKQLNVAFAAKKYDVVLAYFEGEEQFYRTTIEATGVQPFRNYLQIDLDRVSALADILRSHLDPERKS